MIDGERLGERVGIVCFTLSEMEHDIDDPTMDGDAAYLPRGTTLHEVRGSDPRFRIAALTPDGTTKVYELGDVDDAKTGADLLDFSGGVERIVIRSDADIPVTTAGGSTMPDYDEKPVVGTIDDPELIRRLLDDLATAPVSSSRSPSSAPAATRDDEEGYLMLDFERPDGTITRHRYGQHSRFLTAGVQLPPSWTSAINDAISS